VALAAALLSPAVAAVWLVALLPSRRAVAVSVALCPELGNGAAEAGAVLAPPRSPPCSWRSPATSEALRSLRRRRPHPRRPGLGHHLERSHRSPHDPPCRRLLLLAVVVTLALLVLADATRAAASVPVVSGVHREELGRRSEVALRPGLDSWRCGSSSSR